MYHSHNKDTKLDIFPVDSELTAGQKVVSGLITLARVINRPPVTEHCTISAIHHLSHSQTPLLSLSCSSFAVELVNNQHWPFVSSSTLSRSRHHMATKNGDPHLNSI